MSSGYREVLRAVVSDYHHIASTDSDDAGDNAAAAAVLATLLSADIPPGRIVPAIDAAITESRSAGVRVLLSRARTVVIGDPITTARAANDAINVRMVDQSHRRSA